jgi:lipopolysaccharide cholinephosphotransferase
MELELRQLQLKCLEILDIVVKICIEHDIKYSLCGGSVVGAHLYKGFLPWDDDIDIMMTRDNYNKFLEVAKNCLPKGFSIVNYQNSDLSTEWQICFTKIINENTTYVQKNGEVMGVFIDVDVYDKVPESILKEIDLFLCNRILTINNGKKSGNSLKNWLRNLCLDTILSSRRKYLMFFQLIVEFLGKYSKRYTYRELFGAYHGYNMIPYKSSIFENYTTIEFEGRKVMIVRDYIDYLQTRYNRTNFHEPKELQIAPHYKYINFNQPYKEFDRATSLLY